MPPVYVSILVIRKAVVVIGELIMHDNIWHSEESLVSPLTLLVPINDQDDLLVSRLALIDSFMQHMGNVFSILCNNDVIKQYVRLLFRHYSRMLWNTHYSYNCASIRQCLTPLWP